MSTIDCLSAVVVAVIVVAELETKLADLVRHSAIYDCHSRSRYFYSAVVLS